MKRLTACALALILALALATGALASEPEGVENMMGKVMEDFSIETMNGENYTLYEALENHELMVINFWASWCGPCQYEFPFLEEAWEKYSDKIGLIAIDTDTARDDGATIDAFVKEMGLKFPVMSDVDRLSEKLGIMNIPTTEIVNKNTEVVAVEIGAKNSTEEFTDLFALLLGEDSEMEIDDAEDDVAG